MLRFASPEEGDAGAGVAPLVAVAVESVNAAELPETGGGVADFRRDESNRGSMLD